MSYIKRFANFCGGFAAFSAIMYVFTQFMAYKGEEDASRLDNLKKFLDPLENNKLMMPYLYLAAMLVLVVIASHAFKRLPALYFSLSLFPFLYVVFLFDKDCLYERPLLYFVLIGLQIASYLADLLATDRKYGTRHAAWAQNALCLAVSVASLITLRVFNEIKNTPPEELPRPDLPLQTVINEASPFIFVVIAEIFVAIFLVNILLRDVHFIGAIISFIPAIAFIYMWNTERFTAFASVFVAAAVICFITKLSLTLSAPIVDKKKSTAADEFSEE